MYIAKSCISVIEWMIECILIIINVIIIIVISTFTLFIS